MSDTNKDNTPSNYPKWVKKLISELQSARTGKGTIHNLIFRVALALVRTQHDDINIYYEVRAAVANCGREVSEREIWQAITNARRTKRQSVNSMMRQTASELPSTCATPALRGGLVYGRTRKWPDVAEALRTEIIGNAAISPSAPTLLDTEGVVDALFSGDDLLCVGRSNYRFETQTREELRGTLGDMAFIVPSPMSDRTGLTKDGKESAHTLNNTGPRRYCVIEFDTGSMEEQSILLWHLKCAHAFPLVMVVFSGSKSRHGWFDCRGISESQIEAFYRYSVSLGADPATYSRCQFVRMPNGRRENGAKQQVIYFSL